MRTVLLLLVGCAGCRCKEPVAPVALKPAHTQTSWAAHEPAESPGDVYGVPAWSKVFALAFERKVSFGVPACVDDGGCLELDSMQVRRAPTVSRTEVLGKDEPLAFIGEQVTFLEAPSRIARLERAIDEAMKIDPSSAPVAAVLFQNDLWERVDAITHAIAVEPTADWQTLERLRGKLVRLMKHVALGKDQLAALPRNEALVERRFPHLLEGFAARDGWSEVRARLVSRHDGKSSDTTVHAERHGQRMVFRVFVHHPVSAAAFEQSIAPTQAAPGQIAQWQQPQPAGTRFVITGAPVHRTREGELMAAPFITLLESRQARAEGSLPGPIGALGHDVLEGTRASVTRSLADTGGLELLPRDALVPVGATCMPDFTSRLPSASTCLMCHGPTGARITGPMAHGEVRFELTDDGAAAARAVAEAKRASASFQTLRW